MGFILTLISITPFPLHIPVVSMSLVSVEQKESEVVVPPPINLREELLQFCHVM